MTTFDENKYKNLKSLFQDIKEIKMEVRLLYGKDLQKFKEHFYNQKMSEEGLNWFWRFIWDDLDYEELKRSLHL